MIDFSKSYNKEEFETFLRDFLPDDSDFINKDLTIDNSFKYFNKAKLIVNCDSLNNLRVIEIEHTATEDRRITLSREIFRFLSNYTYANALIIIHSEKDEQYRLSFIKSSLEWINEKRVNRLFSSPKRFSFLLGPNTKSYTPKKQLINLGKLKDFSDLEERFNIEVVSEEFYEKYKALYHKLKKYFDKDEAFKEFAERNNIKLNILSKKILGQITFCYFLQKKGWLGAGKKEEFYRGSQNFFRENFNSIEKGKKNFFNDFLEYLFYDSLNNEEHKTDFFSSRLKCKIPFLNGGLFEPINNYDWKKESINIPNSLFSNKNEDGILDIFDLFNFTVDENQSIESEIAVDPEMLGKVYERLIDEALRKKYRPFYTHREIVNYMCTISLIKFLENKFINKLKFVDIEQLINNSNSFLFDGIIDNKIISKTKYSKFLGEIDKELSEILICDPAIGSGAFPVAMMNLITNLRIFLAKALNKNVSTYDLKYNFIKNSIHGVDIDGSAIEIAKLRMWLSLLIEEDKLKKANVLPNLQYRLVQGDSLIESYEDFYFRADYKTQQQFELGQNYNLIDSEFKKLILDQNEYYKAVYLSKKEKLKIEIIKRMEKIAFIVIENSRLTKSKNTILKEKFSRSLKNNNFHNFFPWKLFFASVFEIKKGFDIVIGNPPYAESRSDDFDLDKKRLYLKEIKNKWNEVKRITKGSDLMVYFFPLALELLNEYGINTYITSNSWLSTNYGKNLQSFLLEKSMVKEIIDSDFRYFPKGQGPDVNTIISVICKPNNNTKTQDLKYVRINEKFNNLDTFELQNRKNIKVKSFKREDPVLKKFKWGLIFDADEWLVKIFEGLLKKGSSFYEIGQGLNLKRQSIVNIDIIKKLGIDENLLIPFASKESYYCSDRGSNYLVDKNKCNKEILKILRDNKIIPFNPNSTGKEPPKLFLPRGIADKHHCTTNNNNAFSDSCVDIYFNTQFENFDERVLNFWAFLNSSLIFLFRETSGRKSLGGGLLKAEATDLSDLNLYHEFNQYSKIKEIFNHFSKLEVDNVKNTLKLKEYIELDDIVINHFGIQKYADQIRKLLLKKINIRYSKSAT